MAAKPKLSAKAQKAVDKLDHLEGALLTVQATVGSYVREVQEVKAMFKPEEKNGK